MRLICISDTHGQHRALNLPSGDILIHAGDFTRKGTDDEIQDFNDWLGSLPFVHKIVIAGNHDFMFETHPEQAQALLTHAVYLEDSGIHIQGINFWGSPVSPRFFDWAFNRERGDEIHAHWKKIPRETHVLMTHTPPYGFLDKIWTGRHVGCEALLQELQQRIKPQLLVCGHIHENAGCVQAGETLVLNAASLNRRYQPTQSIWCVDLDDALRVVHVSSG